MTLDGKTAFVTGGNSGIGLSTAKALIEAGARVAITGRNAETLAAAAAELGPQAIAIRADVTDEAAIETAVAEAAGRLGKLDIVFANAGIGGATPLGQTTRERFDSIIETNLTGVFFTVQAALPYLNDGASVILVGSVHSKLGMPGWGAYAAPRAPYGRWRACSPRSWRRGASASTWCRRAPSRRRSGVRPKIWRGSKSASPIPCRSDACWSPRKWRQPWSISPRMRPPISPARNS